MSEDWMRFLFYKRSAFMGSEKSFDEAAYIVFGVPFDATASYRPGARFAPTEIRAISEYLELPEEESIKLADLGDLPLTNSVEIMLRRVQEASSKIIAAEKIPVILGGEHTLTLASASEIGENVGLVVFDAHLDLRNEYMDTLLNHTTWLRRLLEKRKIAKVIVVGARAYVKEEQEYAKENGVQIISSLEISYDLKASVEKLSDLVSGVDGVYLSIDLDVLDPGYAPGVSNPEPQGISPLSFFELIKTFSKIGLRGLDVVEVNPLFDQGQTAANAVYAIYHALLTSSTTSS